jgi:hypothetical protein
MKKLTLHFFALFILFPAVTGVAQDFKQKFELSPSRDIDDSRFTVTATVMDNDTWCRVAWPDPISNPWELAYDDGEADDYFIYTGAGNIHALKFITYYDNFIVTGGRIYVGDGSFPGPFLGTTFRVLVYDDDGEGGLPGTVLDSTDVTVNNYGWVEFEGLTAEIAEGDFYLAMKQLAPSPDAAPIGVDTDNPTYFRSYSYMLVGPPGWVLCPLQDFMIRASIIAFDEPERNIDSFEVARFSGFEFNESPLLGDTTVLDTIELSEYNDYDWDTLDPGLYAFGVKTHFTGGEWSDYDVSNLVTHVFFPFPPACFYQADTGNQSLIFCPPAGLNGELPNFFIGFNLYRDGNLIEFLPPSATSYLIELQQNPGIYSFSLTAVYELSIFGYPNETVESSALFTDYVVRFGSPLPFLEQWNDGTFETNNWLTEGENWSINWQEGTPSPSAEFTWDPIQTDYQISLESYPLLADSLTEGSIYLDFDIKLDNYQPTGNEEMLAQVWNWESQAWATVSTYSNVDGSFDWMSEHIDITDEAMSKVFKIRFATTGENSLNILGWYVDNIHVYRECNPPRELNLYLHWNSTSVLTWLPPFGATLESYEYQWDDGNFSDNSIGTGGEAEFDCAARWTPEELENLVNCHLTEISFVPNEVQAEYILRVWIGENAANLVLEQSVDNPVIGEWNHIALNTPVDIDINQELWVGYNVNTPDGYPAGVDNGPAIDGYGNMMNFGGWQTLLEINAELDFNWNIKANIKSKSITDTVARYALYRSDQWNEFYFRSFSEADFFNDDSAICLDTRMHCYKVTAVYESDFDYCESDFSNLVCEVCENIEEESFDERLNIYPNPASEVIHIESSEEMESVCIIDSQGGQVVRWSGGQVVRWSGGQGKVEIPVGGLAPGLYLVRVETESGVVMRKVVVGR